MAPAAENDDPNAAGREESTYAAELLSYVIPCPMASSDALMADAVEEYLIQLVMATRRPDQYNPQLAEWLEMGASPRGTIALDRCARAHAWLAGRDFVSPEDVQAIAHDVLRHRVLLSFEAEAAGIDSDQAINLLIDSVPVV